jgi:hypothetical protein
MSKRLIVLIFGGAPVLIVAVMKSSYSDFTRMAVSSHRHPQECIKLSITKRRFIGRRSPIPGCAIMGVSPYPNLKLRYDAVPLNKCAASM